MRQTITRIAAVLGFIAITAIGLHKIYDTLRWKDTTGGYLSSLDQLYHTEDNLIDLVFMGSSHCYHGIYPDLLWEEMGIAAFDMSVSSQDKASTYHQLKELLKTQHPRVVVIDLYGITFEKHQVKSNEYRNYLSMKTSPNSIEHVLSYVDKEDQADFLFRWPIIHTRYRELKAYDFVPYEPSLYGRGSLITWDTTSVEEQNGVNLCETVQPLSEENLKWVQNLIDLSNEEGFELIFTLLPYKRSDDIQAVLNGFREYISESNIEFIDLSDPSLGLGLNSETDWVDGEHVNARGAEKITLYLENYIVSNYDLPDRRGDDRYHQWDESLTRFHQLKALEQLKYAGDDEEYFSVLTDTPRLTCLISLEGAYADSPTGIYSYASYFHMDHEDFIQGGKWLYRDGELIKLCENIPGSESVCDLNGIDSLKVCYNGDFDRDNLQISGNAYGITRSGMLIVVYDEIEKKVILTKEIH